MYTNVGEGEDEEEMKVQWSEEEICPLQGKRLWCESIRGRGAKKEGKGETFGYSLFIMKKFRR